MIQTKRKREMEDFKGRSEDRKTEERKKENEKKTTRRESRRWRKRMMQVLTEIYALIQKTPEVFCQKHKIPILF
jgi:hypothetical protein